MSKTIKSDAEHDAGVRRALIAGVAANFGVAVAKFGAFLMTRSVAMLAESVHSLADTTNQAFLLLGMHRSSRPRSEDHPFGHSVERYFWTFIVAMNIFVLGAVVAIYEGISKVRHPHTMDEFIWNYAALALGFIFEGFALRVAWKEFRHFREGQTTSLWRSIVEAKDLSLPTVLFEDTAALLGLILAALGIGLTQYTHNGIWDGIASIAIGVILLGVAGFLARESHSLLIGESATRADRAAIRAVVEADADVVHLVDNLTLQRGPGNVLVALVLKFRGELLADDIERVVGRLELAIRERVPAAKEIFIEAGAFRRSSTRQDGDDPA